jgi:thiosulfate reductase / polysulfide reductase chain A
LCASCKVMSDGKNMMEKVRTICQQCHIECGVIASVENGIVTRIEGDPDFSNDCVQQPGRYHP